MSRTTSPLLQVLLLSGLILVGTAGHSSTANAATMYRYEGNAFDMILDDNPPTGTFTTEMRITVDVEFTESLAPNLVRQIFPAANPGSPVSHTMFDGRRTLMSGLGGGTSQFVEVTTDAFSNIVEWEFGLGGLDSMGNGFIIVTQNTGLVGDFSSICVLSCGLSFGLDQGRVNDAPGSWTPVVPEPSTALLLSLGLAAMGARRRA